MVPTVHIITLPRLRAVKVDFVRRPRFPAQGNERAGRLAAIESSMSAPCFARFHDDFATVSSNDAANNEQPQTRADRLRRKVRLKHAADVFGRYAAACIGKGNKLMSFIGP